MHFAYGSYFIHYIMNKDHKMKHVTAEKYDGSITNYSKSKSIMSYSDVIEKWWNNSSKRRKKKLIKECCIKHENLESEIILENKILRSISSTEKLTKSTSSQYLFDKLILVKRNRNDGCTQGDPPIEIEF